MKLDRIYLSADNAAVNAFLLKKDKAVLVFAEAHSVTYAKIGAMGDERIDLPMLSIEGLGMVGAPANAQQVVKDYVRRRQNGFVSGLEVLDAAFEFHQTAKDRRITHLIFDRDGVLVREQDLKRGPEFYEKIARRMGLDGNPFAMVLTGSSYGQNTDFMKAYGLDKRLADNTAVQRHPWLLLAENGAIEVNVLTGDVLNHCKRLNQELLEELKGPFEEAVMRRAGQEILPAFGLAWSYKYGDQTGKVFVAPEGSIYRKDTMVTLNIPRKYPDGREYRKSGDAERLRKEISRIMHETASKRGLLYEVIGGL